MARQRSHSIPKPLAQGRDRFLAWRRTREVGTRIPDRLWQLAVKLAGTHGLSRTASVLGLDYYALKKRAELRDSDARSTRSPFVELSMAPPGTSGECVIEFEDAAGARMRVHLKGYDAPDLVALGRGFWNGD
jgi:hypothetical protein